MRLLAKIIVLLSVTKSLVGIEYPAPFLEKRVDLNNPAEALRLVRMVEIYPLLIERVGEQEEHHRPSKADLIERTRGFAGRLRRGEQPFEEP